jgi:hypothetical protein
MCLVLVVWKVHPLYPCVVAANRSKYRMGTLALERLRAGGRLRHPVLDNYSH